MTYLLEDPWPLIFLGVAAEAALGVALWQTGRGKLLVAMVAVAAVVLGLVGLEWVVVTEREVVEQTVYDGAAAVESNDPDRASAFLAPGNDTTEQMIRLAMRLVEFTRVKVNAIEIGPINRLTSPPTVKVTIIGMAQFEDRQGMVPYRSHPIDVELTLRLIDGRWRVSEHQWRRDRPPGMP